MLQHLEDHGLFITHHSLAVVPVDGLHRVSKTGPNHTPQPNSIKEKSIKKRKKKIHTHHWPNKIIPVLLDLLQRVRGIFRSPHDITNTLLGIRARRVIQDTAQLVRSGGFFGDFEFEFASFAKCLGRVVGCLVDCCGFGGCCVGDFEEVEGALGGGYAGFVEEGDDVEGSGLEVLLGMD